MITRTLGRSGLEVSALGIGCWAIGGPDTNLGLPMGWGPIQEHAAREGIERAYTLGATLFDTADVYGHGRSERHLGALVAQVPRSALVLTSKVGYFAGTAPHGYHPRHMRHQLEQTLDNLRTDHLDIYFLHHNEFGPGDIHLEQTAQTMRQFRDEGLIRAIGMRGPHRYAPDRLTAAPRTDKHARFRAAFELISPQVLAVRDNLLTPQSRSTGIFAFADEHDCGILINKPLGQGLLTGSHSPTDPRPFGPGDHRSRKRWFTPEALAVLTEGLDQARQHAGPLVQDMLRLALWSCLNRSTNAAVLVGFTTPAQVEMNLTCLGHPATETEIATIREIMARTQRRLDDAGEVFADETATI